MCAICGMIGLAVNESIIKDLLHTMRRRGPDEEGVFHEQGCCLLHTRLSVIDPSGGHQPMKLFWAGKTYQIVYNGELYNTDELRNQLENLGHRFEGHSDTEVVLHAYAQWKEGCLSRCNGIFAFAVWHKEEKKLFLARDRMGVKPLFYVHKDGGFLFASEIKTILKHPAIKPQLDQQGAAEILLLGPGRAPGSGVFKGICELEPGYCAIFENNRLHISRYWSLADGEHTDTFAQTVDTVRYLVTDAIKRQMVSDVPLGTFLSGGLDSSIITAICAEEFEKQGRELPTFSVDYQNNDRFFVPGKFQPDSDNDYIRLMETYVKTKHYWSVLTTEQLWQAMEESTIARDLPGMADVDFSLLQFCKEMRNHVKVALSGECADEIFGGYPWFRDIQIRQSDGFPWAQNTAQRASFLSEELFSGFDGDAFVNDYYNDSVSRADVLPERTAEERRMKQMVYLNQRWFMQTLLDRKDRMSMYSALEVRVPFCDYRIAEYLYRVPWKYKNYRNREKGLLRTAMEGILPEAVLWRKKSPYPKTFDPMYQKIVSDCLSKVLMQKDAPILQIVRKEALENLLEQEHIQPWYGQLMKGPQTIAYMLQINFWLSHYQIEVIS